MAAARRDCDAEVGVGGGCERRRHECVLARGGGCDLFEAFGGPVGDLD